jgi:prophage antirepressor-like protein
MNEIKPFNYNSKEVRVICDKKGSPWWVAKDVCDILEHTDPHKAVAGLDEDERKKVPVIDSMGRRQETHCVSESGLYTLILRSNKPEAKPFRKWVTSEVLPSIRKTGAYLNYRRISISLLHSETESAKMLAKTFGFEGNQALLSANRVVTNIYKIDCLELMGIVHLISDDNEPHVTPTEIGTEIRCSGKDANKRLEAAGLQVGQRDEKKKLKWVPTDKGMPYAIFKDTGKRHSDGTPVQQLFWRKSVLNILNPKKNTSLAEQTT